MDYFPVNLIAAVAAAAAMIFLGFLPTKAVRADFFTGETLKALIAWVLVTCSVAAGIMQYPLFIAIFTFGSWWAFRADLILRGKMWLSLASGIGISVGVMLLLYTTPRAYPLEALVQPRLSCLLASIYMGGISIGLAYIIYRLIHAQAANAGITDALIRRHAGLLFFLALVRIPVVFLPPLTGWHWFGLHEPATPDTASKAQIALAQNWMTHPTETMMVLAGVGLVLPVMAAFVWRAPSHRRRAFAVLLFGLLALGIEILARIVVL